MCKKLIYLCSFILMLGLATGAANADIKTGLVGYWPFDEAFGTTAADVTGNGYNGDFNGDVEWVPGVIGTAVRLDTASERVVIGPIDPSSAKNAMTLAIWMNWEGSGHSITHQGIIGKRRGWTPRTTVKWFWEAQPDGDLQFRNGDTAVSASGVLVPYANEWIHVAVTWDNGAVVQYINAEEVNTGNITFRTTADATVVSIGCVDSQNSESFVGSLDEARIYDRVLTAGDIMDLFEWKGGPPVKARRPSPADEATDVPRDVVLSWTPGEFVPPTNGHTVYFSENFSDVNDGIGGIAQSATTYAPAQRLDFNKTYYWRVDEVNGPPDFTVHEGGLWSFTTELLAYPIGNITATASSSEVGKEPENTINGSGLDDSGLLHGKDPENNVWLSGMTGPQPSWIEYEFDRVYKLYEMWVWNSNESLEPIIGLGFKDVSIEYSVNGTDYTTLGTTHEFARAPGTPDYAHNTTVDTGGVAAKYVKLTANSNWGGILNQYGLSEVRFFYIPVLAREPNPESGATDVSIGTIEAPTDVTLSFRAGREAAKHDVYFGSDQQAVIDGTAAVTTVTEAGHGPLSLDLAQTYYWRVDEVNEAETPATWQGAVWDFTTQEYFVVDDIESYNDLETSDPESNRIFNVWIDGYGVATNGSLVGYDAPPFCERTIVHGGKQSMPLSYNNTGGAAYSEAERTFAVGQNWTQAGAATLVLYFHGAEGNTGQLYLKINGTKVPYGGQAVNLTLSAWQVWNIDLASLGVGLQNVTKLAIGIDGNGASGTLYFDDIGLYVVAPAPVMRIAAGSDDGEEKVVGGGMDLGSSDLELGYEGDMAPASLQKVGCRWVGIPVPKGATITEAWVQFSADDIDNSRHAPDVSVIIEGELSPNPATFSSTAGDISSRPTTTAQVVWDIPQWMTVHAKGPEERTPDISSIIQELINQDGWTGSAIVLMFRDNPAKPSAGTREAESFNGDALEAPLLHISYQ